MKYAANLTICSDANVGLTKPYTFIGFGALGIAKPYGFIGFGALGVTNQMVKHMFFWFWVFLIPSKFQLHFR